MPGKWGGAVAKPGGQIPFAGHAQYDDNGGYIYFTTAEINYLYGR